MLVRVGGPLWPVKVENHCLIRSMFRGETDTEFAKRAVLKIAKGVGSIGMVCNYDKASSELMD